jgi:ribosomal protein S18 acetylase RimI-like enzyme
VTVGWATVEDAPALAALREEMYFSIRLREFDAEWIGESVRFFREELGGANQVVAVARDPEGVVVSSAAATFRRVGPTPVIPRGLVAYVHSVSTRPDFRRRGIARELMALVVEEVDRRGYERVELHATDQGEAIYTDLGFEVRSHSPEMRLDLRARRGLT